MATALLLAAVVSGCSGSTTTKKAATPATSSNRTSPSARSTPSPLTVRNLPADAALKHQLWLAYTDALKPDVRPDEIVGPLRGSVYYAYEPATQRFFALASFDTSTTARMQVMVNSQDGNLEPWFYRKANGPWRVVIGEHLYGPCRGSFPDEVLRAWAITPSCPTR